MARAGRTSGPEKQLGEDPQLCLAALLLALPWMPWNSPQPICVGVCPMCFNENELNTPHRSNRLNY